MTAQDLPTLAASDEEVRKILTNSGISHRGAARVINDNLGEGTTSEKSVRRWRRNAADGTHHKPEPKAAPSPKAATGGAWTPRIDIDKDGGEFFSIPQEASPGAPGDLDENELLGQFDLDPAVWEIVSARKSMWQGGAGGTWLEAHRVSFRKRSTSPETVQEDIEGIFSRYTPPQPSLRSVFPRRTVMVAAGAS